MRKNHLYLFLTVLSSTLINTSSYAQVTGVKITESKELVLNDDALHYGTPVFTDNTFGLVKNYTSSNDKTVNVAGIDLKNDKVIGEKEISSNISDKISLSNTFQFNNKLYLVSYEKKTKTQPESIYFQEIDVKNQTLGERILMASSEMGISGFLNATRVKMGYETTSVGSPGYIDYSTDKSKFVLYYRVGKALLNVDKENEKAKMSFTIFDKDLQKVWSKEIEFPYVLSDKIRYTVDSKNNLYIFVKEYKDGRQNGKDGSLNVKYSLLKLSPTANSFEKIPIPNFGKYLTRVNFYEAPTGEMYVGGFYLKSLKDWEPGGLLIYQVQNGSVSVKVNSSIGVSKEFMDEKTEDLRRVNAAAYAVPLYEYHIKDIRLADGGKFLVTGYGCQWGNATIWSDFQIGDVSSSTQSNLKGFEEFDAIVLLTDSNKIIWNHSFIFRGTFIIDNSNGTPEISLQKIFVFGGSFLIDKNNNVYLFTREAPVGQKETAPGWKKPLTRNIKLNKVNIDGKVESKVISEGDTYLSCGYSDTKGVIQTNNNQLVYVLGGIKGDTQRNTFYKNSGKPMVLKFITVTAD